MNIQLQDASFKVAHPIEVGQVTVLNETGQLFPEVVERLVDTGFCKEPPKVTDKTTSCEEDEHFEIVTLDSGQHLVSVSSVE